MSCTNYAHSSSSSSLSSSSLPIACLRCCIAAARLDARSGFVLEVADDDWVGGADDERGILSVALRNLPPCFNVPKPPACRIDAIKSARPSVAVPGGTCFPSSADCDGGGGGGGGGDGTADADVDTVGGVSGGRAVEDGCGGAGGGVGIDVCCC